MKSRCFQFLTKIIKYYNFKIEDERYGLLYNNITYTCFSNMGNVVSLKLAYLHNLYSDNEEIQYPDYQYKSLIYYMLEFLDSSFLSSSKVDTFNHDIKL